MNRNMHLLNLLRNKNSKSFWSWSYLFLIILVLTYCLFFSAYTLQRHHAHLTAGFDLGNVDQAIWSTLHGIPLGNTTTPGITTRFGLHFEPILFLLVPFYLIHAAPETLLIVQAIVVAAGAIPIFLFARDELGEWPAVVFSAVYLLFPALEAANCFDFHALTLCPTFLAAALWAIHKKRYPLFWFCAVLAMGCKEEIPLVVALLGLIILIRNRDVRQGVTVIFVAACWFALANFIVIPANSPTGANIHYERYSKLGGGLGGIVAALLTRPGLILRLLTEGEKSLALLRLTMPVGFLALLDPLTLVGIVPTVVINLLSESPPMRAVDVYHYWAPVVPFIVVAAITGIKRLADWGARYRKIRKQFTIATLSGMVLILSLAYHHTLGYTPIRSVFSWPQVTAHHRLLETVIQKIPAGASVSAQNPLAPHVSQRINLSIFPNVTGADYILLDTTAPVGAQVIEDRAVYENTIQLYLNSNEYQVIVDLDGYFLLHKRPPM